jgi:hypothetical protein
LKAAAYDYPILCDVRQSKTKVTLADWFYLPRTLEVYKGMKTRFLKTALLINAGEQEGVYKFFETVTRNLGLNIRIFLYEQEDLDWLRKIK